MFLPESDPWLDSKFLRPAEPCSGLMGAAKFRQVWNTGDRLQPTLRPCSGCKAVSSLIFLSLGFTGSNDWRAVLRATAASRHVAVWLCLTSLPCRLMLNWHGVRSLAPYPLPHICCSLCSQPFLSPACRLLGRAPGLGCALGALSTCCPWLPQVCLLHFSTSPLPPEGPALPYFPVSQFPTVISSVTLAQPWSLVAK